MTTPAPSGGPSPLRVGGLALLGLGAVAGIIGLASLATGDGGGNSAAPPNAGPSASAPELPGEGFTPDDGAVPGPGGEGAAPGTPGGEGAAPGTPGGPGAGPGDEGGVPVPSFGPTPAPGTGGAGSEAGGAGAGGTGAGGTGGDGTGAGGTGAGGTGAGGEGAGGTGADGAGAGGTGSGGAGGVGTGAGAGGAGAGGAAGADARMPLRVYNNSTIPGLAARGKADFEAAGWTVTEVGGYNGLIPVSTVYYREGTAERDAAEALAAGFGLRAESRFAGIEDASPGVIVILTRDYQGPEDKSG